MACCPLPAMSWKHASGRAPRCCWSKLLSPRTRCVSKGHREVRSLAQVEHLVEQLEPSSDSTDGPPRPVLRREQGARAARAYPTQRRR